MATLVHPQANFESTVFWDDTQIVLLPLPPCAECPKAKQQTLEQDEGPMDKQFSILIVDDIRMNRIMLKKRMQKCIAPNAVVAEAATGEEALDICDSGGSFDVIIVDQFMEEAGGILLGTDVIGRMRHSKVGSLIIGCSGNDLDSTFYAAGADSVWHKPLPTNLDIIRQLRLGLATRV